MMWSSHKIETPFSLKISILSGLFIASVSAYKLAETIRLVQPPPTVTAEVVGKARHTTPFASKGPSEHTVYLPVAYQLDGERQRRGEVFVLKTRDIGVVGQTTAAMNARSHVEIYVDRTLVGDRPVLLERWRDRESDREAQRWVSIVIILFGASLAAHSAYKLRNSRREPAPRWR
jgi:hypothetical protein